MRRARMRASGSRRRAVSRKRTRTICSRSARTAGVSAEVTDKLTAFVGIYGEMECVLQRLSPLCTTREEQSALRQLQALASLLQATPYAGNIHFDFSIVNNMKYYNGFVFKGFLRGVCQGVLAGGQYDKLMVRLGRSARAIGFALYLDLLDELEEQTDGPDVDVLLLYDAATPPQMLAAKIEALQQAGCRVSAQRVVPEKLRYETVIDLRKEAAEMLNIALPKGRLGEKVYAMFEKAGYACPSIRENNRKLIFENEAAGVRYFWVKPSDVAIYVERGAADLGVAGKDILLEYGPEVYELLDLHVGVCRMAVAGKAGLLRQRPADAQGGDEVPEYRPALLRGRGPGHRYHRAARLH